MNKGEIYRGEIFLVYEFARYGHCYCLYHVGRRYFIPGYQGTWYLVPGITGIYRTIAKPTWYIVCIQVQYNEYFDTIIINNII